MATQTNIEFWTKVRCDNRGKVREDRVIGWYSLRGRTVYELSGGGVFSREKLTIIGATP